MIVIQHFQQNNVRKSGWGKVTPENKKYKYYVKLNLFHSISYLYSLNVIFLPNMIYYIAFFNLYTSTPKFKNSFRGQCQGQYSYQKMQNR